MAKIWKDMALWEEFHDWLNKAWYSADMVEYCYKRCAELVKLPNGKIVDIDKQPLETRFCFGYSDWYGPTDEEASEMAHRAAKSEDYFLRENMKIFKRTLEDLNEHGERLFAVLMPHWGDGNPISGIRFCRVTEVLEAVGGSAFLEELKGTTIHLGSNEGYICTDEDVALLKAGYERAAAAHEKKCRDYLKRYGMSKVETWTYWADR